MLTPLLLLLSIIQLPHGELVACSLSKSEDGINPWMAALRNTLDRLIMEASSCETSKSEQKADTSVSRSLSQTNSQRHRSSDAHRIPPKAASSVSNTSNTVFNHQEIHEESLVHAEPSLSCDNGTTLAVSTQHVKEIASSSVKVQGNNPSKNATSKAQTQLSICRGWMLKHPTSGHGAKRNRFAELKAYALWYIY